MEDLNENIKTLQEKIDNNATKIIKNMNKLHSHEEMINSNSNKIQENSFALEILKDIKRDNQELSKANKRVYVILTTIIILWVITIGYLVYILNDVSTIKITTLPYLWKVLG